MHLYSYNFQLQSNGEESEMNPLNVTWSCENKSERFKQSNMAAKGLTKYIISNKWYPDVSIELTILESRTIKAVMSARVFTISAKTEKSHVLHYSMAFERLQANTVEI